MNLYLLTQNDRNGYDTYDSIVVSAESKDAAKLMHPSGYYRWDGKEWCDGYGDVDRGTWAEAPEGVEVELIGTASAGTESEVILTSFNAG